MTPPDDAEAFDRHLVAAACGYDWYEPDEPGQVLPGLRSVVEQVRAKDPVAHPPHYTSHPSGIECIQITEHMHFTLGNAIKYIWRADEKGNALEDLRKAVWYIEREIARRERRAAVKMIPVPRA